MARTAAIRSAKPPTTPSKSTTESIPMTNPPDSIPVLDKGFVHLMGHFGSDLTVVDCARVSFNKQSGWERSHCDPVTGGLDQELCLLSDADAKLVNYLARNNHWTPFGHPQLQFRIKLPIFVARQLMRSNVGVCWNEISRRYVENEPEFYTPHTWRSRPEGSVKQGSGGQAVTPHPFGEGLCWICAAPLVYAKNGPKKTRKYCCPKCREQGFKDNNPAHRLIQIKARAKEAGLDYDLDPTTFIWPTKCPVFGFDLDYSGRSTAGKDNSPSIDRIDPNKGYTQDNVQVISHLANRMKQDANGEQLGKFSRWALRTFHGQFVPEDSGYEGFLATVSQSYNSLLQDGIAPELARTVLPMSTYTEVIATMSLAACARVFKLRSDSHAQFESRQYASAINQLVRPLFPVSWPALTEDPK